MNIDTLAQQGNWYAIARMRDPVRADNILERYPGIQLSGCRYSEGGDADSRTWYMPYPGDEGRTVQVNITFGLRWNAPVSTDELYYDFRDCSQALHCYCNNIDDDWGEVCGYCEYSSTWCMMHEDVHF